MNWLFFLSAIILAVNTSTIVVSSHYRNTPSICSLDGSAIHPLYEVTIIKKDNSSLRFSCIVSAQIWLRENSKEVFYILVTDEPSGEKINASDAYYVASDVITTPHTGNGIHVFGKKSLAQEHARAFNGKLIKIPFRYLGGIPATIAKSLPNPGCKAVFIFPSSQNPCFLNITSGSIQNQRVVYIYQKYLIRLSQGYFSPPDKPPRKIV